MKKIISSILILIAITVVNLNLVSASMQEKGTVTTAIPNDTKNTVTKVSKNREVLFQKANGLKNKTLKSNSFDLAFSSKYNQIISSGNIDLTISLAADSNVLTDSMLQISIPKEIVANVGQIQHLIDDGSQIFTFANPAYSISLDGSSYILNIKVDTSVNNGAAWGGSFHLNFDAPKMKASTNINPEQTFRVSYQGKEKSIILPIKTAETGESVLFEKWSKFSIDNSDGLYLLDSKRPRYNIYHLAVNINKNALLHHVVVSDELPQGLEINDSSSPTGGISGTDTASIGGVRIIKLYEDGTRKYVTGQYKNNIDVSSDLKSFNVSLGTVNPSDQFLVEYSVVVTEELPIYVNVSHLVSDEVNRTSQNTAKLKEGIGSNEYLTKEVDKTIIAADEKKLTYTFHLTSPKVVLKKGTIFKDTLDSRLRFLAVQADADGLFKVKNNNGKLTITLTKDFQKGDSQDLTFTVSPKGLAIGDTVNNIGLLEILGNFYTTNKVTTKKIDGRIRIKKVDPEGKVLANASFEIKNDFGEVVASIKTNKKGVGLTKGLLPGKYTIIETKAPPGYLRNTTAQNIIITENSLKPLEIVMINKPILGSVELIKKDAAAASKKLKGAEFKLLSKDGKTLKPQLLTDKEGKIIVRDLLPGEYIFKETKAPKGYLLSKVPLAFTIESNQTKTIKLIALNKKIKKKVDKAKPDILLPKNNHVPPKKLKQTKTEKSENKKSRALNIIKLPNTGDGSHCIYVLLISGICLVTLGAYMLKKAAQKPKS
ncbi:Predicted outer membrane protein [Listeria grayi]|uniref:MSCRAMM family protein n=1 Tax=Listeria grayi TaxID=1641 RepID=UPI000F6C05DE|nr:SpaA isopeptide-forming pilin-related protein [Listeria grayi]VEI36645.1 Predicted outer membrane protein [Listeria grayi]